MAPARSGERKLIRALAVAGAVVLGQEFAALTGAVGVAGEGKDLGMVHQAIDHCGCDNVVRERLAPAPEGQVACDHDRAEFVP